MRSTDIALFDSLIKEEEGVCKLVSVMVDQAHEFFTITGGVNGSLH